jgi:ankyrin repeat protein
MELHGAIQNRDIEAVIKALEAGEDVNKKDESGNTPLYYAVDDGGLIETAQLLIGKGADVNARTNEGKTLLDMAIDWDPDDDDCEIGDLLRRHGAKTSEEINTLFDGLSIQEAAYDGKIAAVKQHLAAGADVNATGGDWPEKVGQEGRTPLHESSGMGHKEIVELLIAKGADVNAKDDEGLTPFALATSLWRTEIAELLIVKGADVNAKMNNGHTPLDWTIENQDHEAADLLRKHGGKTAEELKAEGK